MSDPMSEMVQSLVPALKAYVTAYGMPESTTQLQGVVGTLLGVKQQAEGLATTVAQAETVIRQVVAEFEAGKAAQWVIDQAQQRLAEQAHQQAEALERRLKGVVHAYVQQFAPNLPLEALSDVVLTALPMVQDRRLTKAEALGLAEKIATTFSLDTALRSAIGTTSLGLAQDLAIALMQKPMTTAVTETVAAYVRQFEPTLATIGDSLIENAVEAILRNRVEFNIDTQLNLDNRQLLIQQVSFKLNILQADPPASRTAEEIARQIHSAVDRFREERAQALGNPDATAGTLSRDGLSVTAWTASPSPEQTP